MREMRDSGQEWLGAIPENWEQSEILFSDKFISSKYTAYIFGRAFILFCFKFKDFKYKNESSTLNILISLMEFVEASIVEI